MLDAERLIEAEAPHGQGVPRSERAVDLILANSFPASDPPPWTPGIARPGIPVIVRRTTRTGPGLLLQGVGFLIGAVGIALLFPVAILMIGLPVAATVRGGVEVVRWLAALAFK
jgi:hypothetical protein